MYIKKYYHLMILLLSITLISSCKGKGNIETYLVLSGCKAPCWMDIAPGHTTKDEVLTWLQKRPELIDTKSISIHQTPHQWISWIFLRSELEVTVDFHGDIVSTILISDRIPYRDRFGIKLERALKLYRLPTDIFYKQTSGDIVGLEVFIVNRTNGVLYRFIQPEMNKLVISPDQIVGWVMFFNPTDYPHAINNLLGGDDPLKHHYEWRGYQVIELH